MIWSENDIGTWKLWLISAKPHPASYIMIIISRFDVVLLSFFFFLVRLRTVTSAQYFDSSSHLTSIGPVLSSQTPASSQRSTHYWDLIGLPSYYSAYHQISLTLARFGAFHTINTFTWLQAFRSKTKQWSQKFMVWLRRKLQPGLNQILYFHCISPAPFAPPAHSNIHTHWHTFCKCALLKAPNDIPSVSDCWVLFVQWTQWLSGRGRSIIIILAPE